MTYVWISDRFQCLLLYVITYGWNAKHTPFVARFCYISKSEFVRFSQISIWLNILFDAKFSLDYFFKKNMWHLQSWLSSQALSSSPFFFLGALSLPENCFWCYVRVLLRKIFALSKLIVLVISIVFLLDRDDSRSWETF